MKKSREMFFYINLLITQFISKSEQIPWKPCLGITLLTLLPALSCGCSRQECPTHIPDSARMDACTHIRLGGNAGITGTLDIFTFNDDKMQRLDSYQRFESQHTDEAAVASGSGKKLLFVCANSHKDRYDWVGISSAASLQEFHAELEEESAGSPLMTGECRMTAGQDAVLALRPLYARVVLRSLAKDFSLRQYASSRISDIRIYLTNVNASWPLTGGDTGSPVRIVNAGRLDLAAVRRFKEPQIIFQEVEGELAEERKELDICFFCYPNTCMEESPGSPFTRLVIEGCIDGRTYYWPIDINRGPDSDNNGEGIRRNCTYILDVTLKRKGTDDPESVMDVAYADILIETEKWDEKEEYGVRF